MTNYIGRNQRYARTINNQSVMDLLYNAELSPNELADRLQLSTAAISMITTELVKNGYIYGREGGSEKKLGRKPTCFAVNPNFGRVAVVGLSDRSARIAIANMLGEITDTEEINDIENYDIAVLYEIVLMLKNMLAKVEKIPLLGIDISAPGKIEKNTGVMNLSPQFEKVMNEGNDFVSKLFEKHFSVPIKVNNDINLSIIGEMYKGSISDTAQNVLLAHIDDGIGGAFLINRKLYNGSHGYAGEVGMMRVHFEGEDYILDNICSFKGIRRYIKKKYSRALSVEEIIKYYNNGDEDICKHVDATALLLGEKLKDIEELMDLDEIIINGSAVQLGERYIKLVQQQLNSSINGSIVKYSSLKDDASILGAIQKVIRGTTAHEFES